jgi:hypothetical protein
MRSVLVRSVQFLVIPRDCYNAAYCLCCVPYGTRWPLDGRDHLVENGCLARIFVSAKCTPNTHFNHGG